VWCGRLHQERTVLCKECDEKAKTIKERHGP
jgi:hypothetical protein